jgi:hypothetical protein
MVLGELVGIGAYPDSLFVSLWRSLGGGYVLGNIGILTPRALATSIAR